MHCSNIHEDAETIEIEGVSDRKTHVLSRLPAGELLELSTSLENSRLGVTHNVRRLQDVEMKKSSAKARRSFEFVVKWVDVQNPLLLENPAYRFLLSRLSEIHGYT